MTKASNMEPVKIKSPDTISQLPAEHFLVRASDAPSCLPDTLLRPATEMESKPEELLRAVEGHEFTEG